ncbi:MAG: sugar kinase [Schleiferilactobacillus harbinensis]|jgi:2-dehydro-3-deoxygluconokinase|nr:sugar kinase [Schleiferilactobacillus harbinensis]MCI1913864.1 sugar kinase [Schleiferilactobacillus harbinensis]
MKIAAFGEIMLRLTVPEHQLLTQNNMLQSSYTGTGVNILSSLHQLGAESYMISQLPANRLGQAALAGLRQKGLHTDFIGLQGDHLGSFFVELGFGARPTYVTYQNRRASSFGQAEAAAYDFTTALTRVDAVHICGISLSLTPATRTAALMLARQAQTLGKRVYFDFNFRPSLNEKRGHDEIRQAYRQILPLCDFVFGSRRDLTALLDYPAEATNEDLYQRFVADYDLSGFAGVQRGKDKDHGQGTITGFWADATQVRYSNQYPVQVLDRIGTGDAYAAGIIFGREQGWEAERTLAIAIINDVLAHSTYDDTPAASLADIEQVLQHPEQDLIR